MAIAAQPGFNKAIIWGSLKSFLMWALLLEVCFLVVGFPLVTIIVAGGAVFAVALQAMISASAVLIVAGILVSVNVLAVLVGAGLLTMKGIYPHEVSWLDWLSNDADPLNVPIYASCPLTCDVHHA